MKRHIKLFALLGIVFLAAACREDEEVFTYAPVTVGDEVQFGASAYFEMAGGGSSKKAQGTTRTQYGTISGGRVALNWIEGDNIEIVSPQSSVLRAVYAISGVEINNGFENGETEGNSTTTMLRKETDEGIRWGEGYIIDDNGDGVADVDKNGVQQVRMHDFYALYPAIEAFTQTEIENTGVAIGIESAEAENTAIITGYMPNKQNPRGADAVSSNKEGAKYYIEPDMRYAFMAAKTSVSGQTRTDTEGNTYQPQINLEFAPLVTALQFDITGNTVERGDGTITLMALSLRSRKQQICGGFKYDFSTTEVIPNVDNPEDYNTITMDLANSLSDNPIVLNQGEACNVTFFLLPATTFEGLMLDITYRVDGDIQTRTATIGKQIQPKVKYFFDNLVLPVIDAEATGSSWLSALDDDTYVSQLSVPVASNAFTYQYSGENATYYRTQVKSYIDLWNMGIRGFELATSGSGSGNISFEGFVCNGMELPGVTLGQAFEQILTLLKEGEGKDEFAVVICKYQSYGGDGFTYSPQGYVNQLGNYLSSLSNSYPGMITAFEPDATIGNLRGKIAVLVRPGDKDYMNYADIDDTDLTNPQPTLMTLVDDWGSSPDNWAHRYGDGYLTEGAFVSQKNPGKNVYEDVLWGVSTSETEFIAAKDAGGNTLDGVLQTPPEATRNSSYYQHSVIGGGEVMLQSFERVAPAAFATPWMYKKFVKAGEDDAFNWNSESWTRRTDNDADGLPEEIVANGPVGKDSWYTGNYSWYRTYYYDRIHTYEVEITFPETNTYKVTFQYAEGNHRINLLGAEVLDANDNVVSADYHTGYSGSQASNNTYELKDVPAGTYTVRYYCETYTEGNNVTTVNNSGTITYSPSLSMSSTAQSVSLWLRWPESVSEKQAMIDELYNLSVATKGQAESTTIFINSLSGFFLDKNFEKSFYPYITRVDETTDDGTNVSVDFSNAGSGGDYASCAAEMNWYFYQKIKDKSEGPYGLVIMDYLGTSMADYRQILNTSVTPQQAAEAADMLPYLIMMNNFKFPLALKTTDAQAASVGLNEDQPVDPEEPVLAIKWRR